MKRRTGLLFSSAVVVGLLGGAGAGYTVQKHRAPTPLPSLDVAIPAAATAASAAKPDPAVDDVALLDGDLRKLVIDKPSDAKDPSFEPGLSWVSAYRLAEYSRDDDTAFVELYNSGFRRAVERAWQKNGQTVEVDVIQFRTTAGAKAYNGTQGVTGGEADVSGTGGHAYSSDDRTNIEGDHWGAASFQHGDMVVLVYIFDGTKAVNATDVAILAQQQAAKL
jgi:hypothetical protein